MNADDTVYKLLVLSEKLLDRAFDAIDQPKAKQNIILQTMEKIVTKTTVVMENLERENKWNPPTTVGGYSGTDRRPINASFILELFEKYPHNSPTHNVDRLSTFVRAIPVGRMRRGTGSGILLITIHLMTIPYLLAVLPLEPLLMLADKIFKIDESDRLSVIYTMKWLGSEIRQIWNTNIESNTDLKKQLKQLGADNNTYMASIFCNNRRPFSGHYAVLARIVYGLEGKNIETREPNGLGPKIDLNPFTLAVLDDLALGLNNKTDTTAKLETRYNEFFKRLIYFDTYCDPSEAKSFFTGFGKFMQLERHEVCVSEDLYSRFSIDYDKRGTHMSIADFYLLASAYQTIMKAESLKNEEHPSDIRLGHMYDHVYKKFSIHNFYATMSLLNQYTIVLEPNDKQLDFFAKLDPKLDTIYDRIKTDRELYMKQSEAWANRATYLEHKRVFNGENLSIANNPLYQGSGGGASKKKKPASASSAAAKKKKPASASSAAAKKKKPASASSAAAKKKKPASASSAAAKK